MKLKAVIIDDEENVREIVEKLTLSYCSDVEIVAKAGSVKEGLEAIKTFKPHVIFLDIQLPDGTGFDLLKQFPIPSFKIIFITAYDNYAVKAFKWSALDYLLKPIDPDELCTAIDKAKQTLEQEDYQLKLQAFLTNMSASKAENRKLVLKTAESIYVVSISDIVRCQSFNNYTEFFLSDGKRLIVSTTLKEYDEMLENSGFFRSHQSHLLNLQYFERYDKREGGYVVMKDKSTVPVAIRKRDLLLQTLRTLN